MNPYARFGLVSNTVSAALIVGGLVAFGPAIVTTLGSAFAGEVASMVTLGVATTVLVVFWLAMTEAIFPSLFRINSIRRMILGKYYIEGTWIQAERAEAANRMAVIDIQPSGKSFIFSGYALNENFEIESNVLIEFSNTSWPFITYKYRNSLSDGRDGLREGVGEIQFEMNSSSARRFNGFVQFVSAGRRVNIEGSKLTSSREVRKLRSLEGRHELFEKYWELFFNRSLKSAKTATKDTPVQAEPVISEPVVTEAVPVAKTEAPVAVVPRRRASDWANAKPAAQGPSRPARRSQRS